MNTTMEVLKIIGVYLIFIIVFIGLMYIVLLPFLLDNKRNKKNDH